MAAYSELTQEQKDLLAALDEAAALAAGGRGNH